MSVGIKQFWTNLIESKLLEEGLCELLESKFQAADSIDNKNDLETLANWLCQQKAISPFQADILLANQATRLRYGNYVIVSAINPIGRAEVNETGLKSAEGTAYIGRHSLSGQNVKLTFFSGDDHQALLHWKNAFSTSIRCSENEAISSSPHITEIYDTVAIAEYRFVVSEIPAGKNLSNLVPDKARLPDEKLLPIINQLAIAFSKLHVVNLGAGPDLAKRIFMVKSGRVQIEPQLMQTPHNAIADDIRELGWLWYRLATGRLPKTSANSQSVPHEEFIRLKKYQFKNDTIRLLQSMLFAKPEKRPEATIVAEHLQQLAPLKSTTAASSTGTLVAYKNWLNNSPIVKTDSANDFVVPDQSELPTAPIPEIASGDFTKTRIEDLDSEPIASKKSNAILLPLVGSILAIAAVVGTIFLMTANAPHGTVAGLPTETIATTASILDHPVAGDSGSSETETGKSVGANAPKISKYVSQRLIDDDQTSLWETPTTGAPIDFSHVPTAPKIAFVIRPAELLATAQGHNILRSLGPEINSELDRLLINIGFPLEQIEQLFITYHSSDNFTYEPFFRITLTESHSALTMEEAWQQTETKTFEETEYRFRDESHCFFLTDDPSTENTRFTFSNQRLIEESLSLGGINAIGGSLKRLAKDSDRNRHVTALMLRAGLFNDEGQKLMGRSLTWLNRRLSLAIDQFVRGFAISTHIEDGTYLEIDVDHTVDLKPNQLQTQIRNELTNMATEVRDYSVSLASNSFWDNARIRSGSMMADLVGQLRIGSEGKQVLCKAGITSRLYTTGWLQRNYCSISAIRNSSVRHQTPSKQSPLNRWSNCSLRLATSQSPPAPIWSFSSTISNRKLSTTTTNCLSNWKSD